MIHQTNISVSKHLLICFSVSLCSLALLSVQAEASPHISQAARQVYTADSSPEIFYMKGEREDETLPVSGPRFAPFRDKSGDIFVAPESLKPLGLKMLSDDGRKLITLQSEDGDTYATKRQLTPQGHPGYGGFVSLNDIVEHYGGRVSYDSETNTARIISRVTKMAFEGDSLVISTSFPVQGAITQSRDKQQIQIELPYTYLEDGPDSISDSSPRFGQAMAFSDRNLSGGGVRVTINLKNRMNYAGMSSRTRTAQFRLTLLPEWDKDRPSASLAVRTRVGAPAPTTMKKPTASTTPSTAPSTPRTVQIPPVKESAPPVSTAPTNPKISRIYEVSFTPAATDSDNETSATLEVKADQIPAETTLPVRFWTKGETVGIDFWNSSVPAQVIEDLRDSIKDQKTPYGRLFSDVTYTKLSGNASRLTFTARKPVSFLAKMGRTSSDRFRINNGMSVIFTPQVKPEELPTSGAANGLLGKLVIVDPGHGGSDPGSRGGGEYEKNNTLGISYQLVKKLREMGANVVMTRGGDGYPALGERSFLANRNQADYFVSVHCDDDGSSGPSGWTAIYRTNNAFGRTLAQSIHDAAIAHDIPRGNRSPSMRNDSDRGSLSVLRRGQMAAVLFEAGFISNATDRAMLRDPEWRKAYARAIADGVEAFARVNSDSKRVNTVKYPDDLGGFGFPKEIPTESDAVTIRL
jgi:N-acetylmuramoyl-L-alanine amidase